MKLELLTKEFKLKKINCEPDNNCNPYYGIPNCEPGNTFNSSFACRPEITGNVIPCVPIIQGRYFDEHFDELVDKRISSKDSTKENKNNGSNGSIDSTGNNNDKK